MKKNKKNKLRLLKIKTLPPSSSEEIFSVQNEILKDVSTRAYRKDNRLGEIRHDLEDQIISAKRLSEDFARGAELRSLNVKNELNQRIVDTSKHFSKLLATSENDMGVLTKDFESTKQGFTGALTDAQKNINDLWIEFKRLVWMFDQMSQPQGSTRLDILLNGVDLGTIFNNVNLIAGTGISITSSLDTTNRWVDLTISSTSTGAVWGSITGTITDQTDLIDYIASVVALEPGGDQYSIQINNGDGTFYGNNNFQFNGSQVSIGNPPDNIYNSYFHVYGASNPLVVIGSDTGNALITQFTGDWNGYGIVNPFIFQTDGAGPLVFCPELNRPDLGFVVNNDGTFYVGSYFPPVSGPRFQVTGATALDGGAILTDGAGNYSNSSQSIYLGDPGIPGGFSPTNTNGTMLLGQFSMAGYWPTIGFNGYYNPSLGEGVTIGDGPTYFWTQSYDDNGDLNLFSYEFADAGSPLGAYHHAINVDQYGVTTFGIDGEAVYTGHSTLDDGSGNTDISGYITANVGVFTSGSYAVLSGFNIYNGITTNIDFTGGDGYGQEAYAGFYGYNGTYTGSGHDYTANPLGVAVQLFMDLEVVSMGATVAGISGADMTVQGGGPGGNAFMVGSVVNNNSGAKLQLTGDMSITSSGTPTMYFQADDGSGYGVATISRISGAYNTYFASGDVVDLDYGTNFVRFLSGATAATPVGFDMWNFRGVQTSIFGGNNGNGFDFTASYDGNYPYTLLHTSFDDGLAFYGPGSVELLSIDTSGNGIFVGNITSPAFITDGGSSSQFVKGDGSLDSTTYSTFVPSGTVAYQGDNISEFTNDAGYITSSSLPIAGTNTATGVATTTFTVTIGVTMANTTYKVVTEGANTLSAAVHYVNNKTTTTFDVVYLTGLTGAVVFDWAVFQ